MPCWLQWSHILADMETTQNKYPGVALHRFNGATSFGTWKSFLLASSPRQPCRFNGATSLRTWKRANGDGGYFHQHWLQWSHVLADMETTGSRQRMPALCACFNGAMSERTWQ